MNYPPDNNDPPQPPNTYPYQPPQAPLPPAKKVSGWLIFGLVVLILGGAVLCRQRTPKHVE